MRYLLTSLLFLGWQIGQSQTIPSERLVTWSTSGMSEPCFSTTQTINILDAGGHADGLLPNDEILENIIDTLTQPSIIFFPGGTYLFNDQISLVSNMVLQGAGAANTEFVFDLSAEKDLIAAKGAAGDIIVSVLGSLSKGSSTVSVADASSFAVGDYILVADDDDDLVNNSWAINTTGQICQITAKSGSNLTLSNPLRRSYSAANSPFVRNMEMLNNVGLEGLTIMNLNATETQRSNIFYRYVYNGYVKCVASYNTNYAHIELEHSAHCEISGNYMQDAFAYDDGGQGYGVLVHYASGDNLVTDNTMKHLRHSMILQAGANGNVFSYNYSEEPYWTGTVLPADAAGDLVLHGNYPYANLFEGNEVQNIIIDDSHGLNGPYNTFFRNRADNYGIAMTNETVGDSMTFVGNEVTDLAFLHGLYSIYGTGHFEYGNNIKGIITPAGTTLLPEATLYLPGAPEYYTAAGSWPPIGIPNSISEYNVAAEERFNSGVLVLCNDCLEEVCEAPSSLVTGPINTSKAKLSWNDVVDASKYELYHRKTGTSTWNKLKLAEHEYMLTGLIPGTAYQWKVRSRCPEGWTTFSPVENFSTLPLRTGSLEIDGFSVYPNPAGDYLNVHIPFLTSGDIGIRMINLQGSEVYRTVIQHEGDEVNIILTHGCTAGTYIMEVTTNEVIQTQLIVIE